MGSEPAGIVISAALEREYNLRIRHPERDDVYRDFAERSARYRAASPCRLDLRYAEGERCTLDFFPGRGADAPLLVFFHGGYWRALDKSIFSFLAQPYNDAGAAVALVGYDLAPAATLTRIVGQAQRSLAWLAAEHGLAFERQRIVVSGHSAGGHLAALLGTASRGFPGEVVPCAVVAVSGIFDLVPLLGTSVNLDVRMSEDEARTLSPGMHTTFLSRRFVIAVGERETDGFIAQSRAFAAHAEALGCATRYLVAAGRTHFDVLEDLAGTDRPLGRATLDLLVS